jgi:hypothetical protein
MKRTQKKHLHPLVGVSLCQMCNSWFVRCEYIYICICVYRGKKQTAIATKELSACSARERERGAGLLNQEGPHFFFFSWKCLQLPLRIPAEKLAMTHGYTLAHKFRGNSESHAHLDIHIFFFSFCSLVNTML